MTCFRPRPQSVTRSGAFVAWALLLLVGAAGAARSDTLERIRSEGTIRLGYRADAQPFSYRDESGKPAGYAVVLCERVAQAVKADLGLEQLDVAFTPVETSQPFDPENPGRLDLLCGAVVSLERRESFSFSIPIFPSGVSALLRADSPERLKKVLEGEELPILPQLRVSLGHVLEKRVVSAQQNTMAERWLVERRDEIELNTEVVPVQSYDEGVQRVLKRESDVLFGDRAVLLNTAARSPEAGELVVLKRIYTHQPVAMGLARNEEDFRLVVDRALSRLYRSGQVEAIYTSFFGRPDATTKTFFELTALPE